jgi:pimeloyl-ACP methyl ester carboxylesterase
LKVQDFMVPAHDSGIQLFVRNRWSSEQTAFSAEKTVLFVHGATYPAEALFDLPVGGTSWTAHVAQRGYDVYLVDVRGYGRSTRPAAMAESATMNPPFAFTADAVRDVARAVDFILERRRVAQLTLIAWSWGTTIAALYAIANPAKVAKVVMVAPVWTPPSGTEPPPVPTTAYRAITIAAAHERWLHGVPSDKRHGLIPNGWFDTWARELLASDPEGARHHPPVLRVPNGALVDIYGKWFAGKPMYDAAAIRVPTMIARGEWDVDTPVAMARGLFEHLTGAPYKLYTEIGEATHTVMLEKNRMHLFRAVQSFIDE